MKTQNIVIIAVLVGVICFFTGYKFGHRAGGAPGQGQFAGRGLGSGPADRVGNMRGNRGSGFTGGEVLSKDDKSVTIKLRDGGSKIVYYTASTSVQKMVAGALTDVVVGGNITVTGSANQDGSVAADSIQIRPENAPGPGPKGN